MDIERTPDERFDSLSDWPYEPRYATVGEGLRMHYIGEGPPDGPVVVLAHGEPTWGYLYRKMIPGLVAAGRRALVPDLIGFGRSDKPVDRAAYTYESHVAWTGDWLDQLDLTDITLFGQDWGGFIFNMHAGLTPDRFAAVVVANTGLAAPDVMGSHLVPLDAADPSASMLSRAWAGLTAFEMPVLTAFAEHEDITRSFEQVFQDRVPGAKGREHLTVPDAGHFLQEQQPDLLVEAILSLD